MTPVIFNSGFHLVVKHMKLVLFFLSFFFLWGKGNRLSGWVVGFVVILIFGTLILSFWDIPFLFSCVPSHTQVYRYNFFFLGINIFVEPIY
jgi:hypothetical protein